jgi:Protein of unknown function (DUF1579)
MDFPEPTEQHRWLAQLEGSWKAQSEPVPGHEFHDMGGTEAGRMLGGFWIELAGEAGPWPTRMTLGFNPETGRFIGTWIGGMGSHLWIYDGALSADGRTLVLASRGPAFSGEGLADYQDVIEIVGPDERTLRAYIQKADGSWDHFMTTRYRRA